MSNLPGPDDPGSQDECATCGHARWRHRPVDGSRVCTEYLDCACEGNFVELSQATRMARVIDAAGTLAGEFATFRSALQSTLQALHALHTSMRVAGLLPEEDQPGPHTSRGRHAVDMEAARQEAIEHISGALDVPQALITGPSLDGLPDHWGDAARLTFPSGPPSVFTTCPTCWPRRCDPQRSMCRQNPDATQAIPAVQDNEDPDQNEPHLCDGCGRTDRPVTATDDGRALACPDCLPAANANIAADHEHGPDCVRHGCPNPTSPPIPDPATYNSPFRTPNDPPHTHQPGCRHHGPKPATQPQTGLQSHPEQADPPA